MLDDGAREGVLGVGVDVHLHDSVADRLGDLFRTRSRTAVEDEVERSLLADFGADLLLDLTEEFGAQLHIAGLVHAVDVSEGQSREVAALLAGAQGTRGGQPILDGGVELVVDLVLDAVLFAADDADLDLEDRVRGRRELEQLLGEDEVLVEGNGRAVPHVRLEVGLAAVLHALGRCGQQGLDPRFDGVLRGVVGVQCDVDVVALGHLGGEDGERDGTAHSVLDRRAGHVFGAARGDLHDAVGSGLGEAADGGVDRLRGGAVDRGVGEALGLRAVDHLGIHFGAGDGHVRSLVDGSVYSFATSLLVPTCAAEAADSGVRDLR